MLTFDRAVVQIFAMVRVGSWLVITMVVFSLLNFAPVRVVKLATGVGGNFLPGFKSVHELGDERGQGHPLSVVGFSWGPVVRVRRFTRVTHVLHEVVEVRKDQRPVGVVFPVGVCDPLLEVVKVGQVVAPTGLAENVVGQPPGLELVWPVGAGGIHLADGWDRPPSEKTAG